MAAPNLKQPTHAIGPGKRVALPPSLPWAAEEPVDAQPHALVTPINGRPTAGPLQLCIVIIMDTMHFIYHAFQKHACKPSKITKNLDRPVDYLQLMLVAMTTSIK